jgi:peptidoglycan/xylan/chitin deacetylase (PgdA/CDA1 family)
MIYNKNGMVVRLVYLAVSLIIWVVTLGGRIFGRRSVVLCYHGIIDSLSDSFRRQMAMVSHRTVGLEGLGSPPRRLFSSPSVIVTFDDAFENLLYNALPVLEEFNLPASVYVVTGYMGRHPEWLRGSEHPDENKRLMDQEQVKHLASHRLLQIGSHTHTHQQLSNMSEDGTRRELLDSKSILEGIVGCDVDVLAYPHGSHNKSTSRIAKQCGFSKVLTLDERLMEMGEVNTEIGRFSMEPNVWSIEFRLTIDGAYFWLYYFRRMVRWFRELGEH